MTSQPLATSDWPLAFKEQDNCFGTKNTWLLQHSENITVSDTQVDKGQVGFWFSFPYRSATQAKKKISSRFT